jgi:phage-related protein
MTQPTFALPCEYGLEVTRRSYGQRIKLATTSGAAIPSADELGVSSYQITTVPIDNDVATSLDRQLQALRGSYFHSKFYFDDVFYKYRIVDDEWKWQVTGPISNVFVIEVERIYEPTVEFAIDYGNSQEQQVSAHIFRIASTAGTAVPAIAARVWKTASVRTRPMSKIAATALEAQLVALNGSAFYSQIYLDTVPRLYRLQPYQWSWTPDSEDGYVCEFAVIEVIGNATDIPCSDTLELKRTSRVRTVQFGDGYQQSTPDGINTEDYFYSIETLPLSDTQSAAVEAALSALKGNTFYAKFKNDLQVYKYRLDQNNWSWRSSGRDANVFAFTVKRAYDL